MLFKEINILDELHKEELKNMELSSLIQAREILQNESLHEARILEDIEGKNKPDRLPNSDGLSLFSEESIKNICVKYRLRFLDSSLFKGEIPYEAIQKVKQLEKKFGLELRSFKIIAPASRFSLKDSTKDPILLAKTVSGEYLFIHKWGKDMEWYHKLLYFPFSNIQNLAISAMLLALLVSVFIPNASAPDFYTRTTALLILYKSMIFFALTGLIFSASLALGIIFSKDFSDDVWNDKYFN